MEIRIGGLANLGPAPVKNTSSSPMATALATPTTSSSSPPSPSIAESPSRKKEKGGFLKRLVRLGSHRDVHASPKAPNPSLNKSQDTTAKSSTGTPGLPPKGPSKKWESPAGVFVPPMSPNVKTGKKRHSTPTKLLSPTSGAPTSLSGAVANKKDTASASKDDKDKKDNKPPTYIVIGAKSKSTSQLDVGMPDVSHATSTGNTIPLAIDESFSTRNSRNGVVSKGSCNNLSKNHSRRDNHNDDDTNTAEQPQNSIKSIKEEEEDVQYCWASVSDASSVSSASMQDMMEQKIFGSGSNKPKEDFICDDKTVKTVDIAETKRMLLMAKPAGKANRRSFQNSCFNPYDASSTTLNTNQLSAPVTVPDMLFNSTPAAKAVTKEISLQLVPNVTATSTNASLKSYTPSLKDPPSYAPSLVKEAPKEISMDFVPNAGGGSITKAAPKKEISMNAVPHAKSTVKAMPKEITMNSVPNAAKDAAKEISLTNVPNAGKEISLNSVPNAGKEISISNVPNASAAARSPAPKEFSMNSVPNAGASPSAPASVSTQATKNTVNTKQSAAPSIKERRSSAHSKESGPPSTRNSNRQEPKQRQQQQQQRRMSGSYHDHERSSRHDHHPRDLMDHHDNYNDRGMGGSSRRMGGGSSRRDHYDHDRYGDERMHGSSRSSLNYNEYDYAPPEGSRRSMNDYSMPERGMPDRSMPDRSMQSMPDRGYRGHGRAAHGRQPSNRNLERPAPPMPGGARGGGHAQPPSTRRSHNVSWLQEPDDFSYASSPTVLEASHGRGSRSTPKKKDRQRELQRMNDSGQQWFDRDGSSRRHGGGNDNSSYHSDMGNHHNLRPKSPHSHRDLVQIYPGVYVPLRSATETENAIASDFYIHTKCVGCIRDIFCILDAAYVICPSCKFVSALDEEKGRMRHGLGIGFTGKTLCEMKARVRHGGTSGSQRSGLGGGLGGGGLGHDAIPGLGGYHHGMGGR